MGFLKLQFQLIVVTILAFFSLPFLPVPFNFEPVAYQVNPPSFTGPLTPNTHLDTKSKVLFQNELFGPECFAHRDGYLYTGTRLGDVWKFNVNTLKLEKVANTGKQCKGTFDEENCGRVLGLRFSKSGDLYAIDAFKGLLKIDVKSGKVETLLKNGDYVGSQKLIFGDDLEIDDESGIIYFTQASTKWGLHQVALIPLEHDDSGRILTYDTKTKKAAVLLDRLQFPNGLSLSHDGQSLLYAELNNHRIMQYQLIGANKGKVSVFADRLPGPPDNIKQSPSGGYWVAFESSRNAFAIVDFIAPYPLVAKAVVRFNWLVGQFFKKIQEFAQHPTLDNMIADFEHSKILFHGVPNAGVVVELDKSGKVIRSLHSDKLNLFSDAFEHENFLYLGSVIHPYVLRVKLD